MIASVLVRADDRPSGLRELRDAMSLALVPIGVALTLGMLLLPRSTPPDSVPLPLADSRQLARIAAADHQLAERARSEPLPGPVRALGSALRAFHDLEAQGAEVRDLGRARSDVDRALVDASTSGDDALLRLRAVQLEGFLDELRRFESTGVESPELAALGGGFVRSMRLEGWCEGHALAAPEPVRRAMFKQMWNGFLKLDSHKELATPLDELRALYAFYLARPHSPQATRDALAAARLGATDARACQAVAKSERLGIEAWRLERVRRLAAVDPAYPGAYALGVASYRHGDYGAAAEAFRVWLTDHPDGPFALRAQGYLRAAVDAERAE